jgi:hypothetical protein
VHEFRQENSNVSTFNSLALQCSEKYVSKHLHPTRETHSHEKISMNITSCVVVLVTAFPSSPFLRQTIGINTLLISVILQDTLMIS